MNLDFRIKCLHDQIDDLRDDRIDAEQDEDWDLVDYLSSQIEKLTSEVDELINQSRM